MISDDRKPCSTPGCPRPRRQGGTFCRGCYQRAYRHRDPRNAERNRAAVAAYARANPLKVRQWRENARARLDGREPRDMSTVPFKPRGPRPRAPRQEPLPWIPSPRQRRRIDENAAVVGWQAAIENINRPPELKP